MLHNAREFPVEAYRLRVAPDHEELFVQAPTWAFNPGTPFSTFAAKLESSNDRERARILRDICCAPTIAGEFEPLFRDPEIVERNANPKRRDPLLPDGTFAKWFHGKSRNYFAHLDLSQKRDATGIAVGHMEKRSVVIDLMMERKVPDGGELRFKDTREIIYELQRRGFWFQCVSADGWNSAETLQDFEIKGIKTKLVSVDKGMKAYDTLYELVVSGNLDYYAYEPFFRNCRSLIVIGGGKKVDHLPEASGGCFSGDTKVSLVSGEEISLRELKAQIDTGTCHWIYSVDLSSRRIVPAQISSVRISGCKPTCLVRLDNDESIRCTLDHRFMLRDGSYRTAAELRPGDSLMPLYRRVSTKGLVGYGLLYDTFEDRWRYEHRYFVGALRKGYVVHHKNFVKTDNAPSNLQTLSVSEHTRLHNNMTKDYLLISRKVTEWHRRNGRIGGRPRDRSNEKTYPSRKYMMRKMQRVLYNMSAGRLIHVLRALEYKARKICLGNPRAPIGSFDWQAKGKDYSILCTKTRHAMGQMKNALRGLQKYNLSLAGRKQHSETITRLQAEGKLVHTSWMKGLTVDDPRVRHIVDRGAAARRGQSSWAAGISRDDPRLRRFIEAGVAARKRKVVNHTVISVDCDMKHETVFDLAVAGLDNFALTAGVFVHNSKDVADAAAGVCVQCLESRPGGMEML